MSSSDSSEKILWLSYELSTEDSVLELVPPERPLKLLVGTGQLHPALESRVAHLEPGDKFSIDIDPSLAFGEVNAELQFSISKRKLPEHLREMEVGAGFEAPGADRKKHFFRLVARKGVRMEFDGNHPLAGEVLHFEGQVMDPAKIAQANDTQADEFPSPDTEASTP